MCIFRGPWRQLGCWWAGQPSFQEIPRLTPTHLLLDLSLSNIISHSCLVAFSYLQKIIFSTGLLLQLEAWKLLKIYSRVLLPLGPYQALKNILKRCALPTNYRYRNWPFTMSQCYLDLNISKQQFVKGQSSNRRTKIKYN